VFLGIKPALNHKKIPSNSAREGEVRGLREFFLIKCKKIFDFFVQNMYIYTYGERNTNKMAKYDYIKMARHALKMTQEQLATAVSVSRNTIISIERDNHKPQQVVLDKINKLLQERGIADNPNSLEEYELLHYFRGLPQDSRSRILGIVRDISANVTIINN